jgi:hypothetical protein
MKNQAEEIKKLKEQVKVLRKLYLEEIRKNDAKQKA